MSGKDDFNRLRARFIDRVNAPDIPALALKLAHLIIFRHMDTKRRITFVSQPTLARELGADTRTVRRMIDVLRRLGLSVAPGHGPNHASTYWIEDENRTPMSAFEVENRTPMSAFPASPTGHLTTDNRTFDDRKPDTHVRPSLENSKRGSNKSAPSARSSADDDRESATTTSGKTTDDEIPNQRTPEGALIDTVAAKQPPSCRASEDIGIATRADADPAFAEVYRRGREVLGADADAVTAKLLSAYDGDAEAALDALAVAEDEGNPRQYIEKDIEAAARAPPMR